MLATFRAKVEGLASFTNHQFSRAKAMMACSCLAPPPDPNRLPTRVGFHQFQHYRVDNWERYKKDDGYEGERIRKGGIPSAPLERRPRTVASPVQSRPAAPSSNGQEQPPVGGHVDTLGAVLSRGPNQVTHIRAKRSRRQQFRRSRGPLALAMLEKARRARGRIRRTKTVGKGAFKGKHNGCTTAADEALAKLEKKLAEREDAPGFMVRACEKASCWDGTKEWNELYELVERGEQAYITDLQIF